MASSIAVRDLHVTHLPPPAQDLAWGKKTLHHSRARTIIVGSGAHVEAPLAQDLGRGGRVYYPIFACNDALSYGSCSRRSPDRYSTFRRGFRFE